MCDHRAVRCILVILTVIVVFTKSSYRQCIDVSIFNTSNCSLSRFLPAQTCLYFILLAADGTTVWTLRLRKETDLRLTRLYSFNICKVRSDRPWWSLHITTRPRLLILLLFNRPHQSSWVRVSPAARRYNTGPAYWGVPRNDKIMLGDREFTRQFLSWSAHKTMINTKNYIEKRRSSPRRRGKTYKILYLVSSAKNL